MTSDAIGGWLMANSPVAVSVFDIDLVPGWSTSVR
jgi:hypothetical protein